MSSQIERTLAIIQLLSQHPEGMSVGDVAAATDIPASAAHRLLNELVKFGYVRQARGHGDYGLTIKMATLGLTYLGKLGIIEITQPIIDQLADESKELVRIAILHGDDLVWVARAQGTHFGLRYDPDYERSVSAHLATSATGQAWLMTLSDEEALMRVATQGFIPQTHAAGQNAPKTAKELLQIIEDARARGYTQVVDGYLDGMSAMAAPFFDPRTNKIAGVVSIAGPSVRLTPAKMTSLGPRLMDASQMLTNTISTSRLLTIHPNGN